MVDELSSISVTGRDVGVTGVWPVMLWKVSRKPPLWNSSRYWLNCSSDRVPPWLSMTALNTSVLTRTFSPAGAGAVWVGSAIGLPGIAAAPGTAPVDPVPVDVVGVPAAVCVCTGFDEGRKVGLLPLWTCHWSHSITSEKPKITSRMVRRISFMKKTSCLRRRRRRREGT